MRLRIKTRSGEITDVSKILTIKAEADNLSVTSGSNTITLRDSKESYAEWYNTFIDRKTIAMHGGGDMEDSISFTVGIQIYTHAEGKPYLKSITSSTPDEAGNIQLLPGSTLDIIPADGRISFEQINIPVDGDLGFVLEDINKCVWYLYHTYNSFLYRMNLWEPNTTSSPMFTDARMLGTIRAYQAVVAAWNMRVWRRSFLWDISPIRETVSFSIGYMALDCINPSVTCNVKITNARPANDTTKFLTIYDQGISTNMSLSSVDRSITKTTADGDINVDGAGTDKAASEGVDWNTISIKINLGVMKQGEYYKAAFSIAVAQNETTALYYQKVDTKTHTMNIETIWTVDTDNVYGFNQEANVPAMLLYEDISENADGGYIQ